MSGKQSLVARLGSKLPGGMSKADAEAVLQFLYGAFDKRAAKQVTILHPYAEMEDSESSVPEVTVYDFCRWLQVVAA